MHDRQANQIFKDPIVMVTGKSGCGRQFLRLDLCGQTVSYTHLGRVAEQGTHAELLQKSGGIDRRVYDIQTRKEA